MNLRLAFLLISFAGSLTAQEALRLRPQQVYNQTGQGQAWYLFDEPGLTEPKTVYEQGYDQAYGPAELLIDLQEQHVWSHLRYYDTFGRGKFEVYLGRPGQWQLMASPITNSYRQWRRVDLKQGQGRFLRLLFLEEQAKLAELELYAHALVPLESAENKAAPADRPYAPIAGFWGLNVLHNDAFTLVKKLGFRLREYHRWNWDERHNAAGEPRLAWQPSWVSAWHFDDYYRQMAQAGQKVTPCLQSRAAFLPNSEKEQEAKPNQGPAHLPTSYQQHAEYCFQFAARYGAQAWPASVLRLRDDQEPKSGLNYLAALEPWNEPDKWWKGRRAYFRPFEYAAMLSADYDGHEGKLGPGTGIKQADSTLPVVMAGLAELDLNYLRNVKLWCDWHRESGFPAEVLNFHHYAYAKDGDKRRGIAPEADSLYAKLRRLVDWRNAHLPQQELWLTEFGYDSQAESPQGIGPNPHYAPETLRSAWILRSYLLAYAAGFDRAYLYMLRDVNSAGKGKYQSSGLSLDQESLGQKKGAYAVLQAFSRALADHRLVEKRTFGAQDRYHLVFARKGEKAQLHVLWSSADHHAPQSLKLDFVPGKSYALWEKGKWQQKAADQRLTLGAMPRLIKVVPHQ